MPTATPAFAAPVEATAAGWIEIHPRYRTWLRKCGIASASDVLALRGEVVCGHADRHVVKVELGNGVSVRGAYLKREHIAARRARYRNWRAGFGWVSRAQREATTLQKLETLGLHGPQWLAYGEDAEGRAYLLIEELTDALPLRELLADYTLSADDVRLLAERLGRMIAECHAVGIGTPELAAKHVLVRPGTWQPILIDWQSSHLDRAISEHDAARWFGALDATLPGEQISTRDRVRVVWAYRRVMKASGFGSGQRSGDFARDIRSSARLQSKRSSVRQQLASTPAEPQRLVWLHGEALVAIPEVADCLPVSLYGAKPGTERITLLGGRLADITRFHTSAPLGRLVASLRERPWRSPGATAARTLFHLRRFGIPGPKLLAFGQRRTSLVGFESFVLVESAVEDTDPLSDPANPLRNRVLADIGKLLKRLHNTDCRFHRPLLGVDPLLTQSPELSIRSASAISIVRRVTDRQARSDLAGALAGMDRLDKMRVLRAYLGSGAADCIEWDRFARAVS